MAIYKPGQRFRYHNLLSKKSKKRAVTVILSLTAMVDMFTVLVIFLLQNYNATGEILYLPKEVTLPKASTVVDLKPSVVVTISPKEVLIDENVILNFDQVKNSPTWSIPTLRDQLKKKLEQAKAEQDAKLQSKLENVVNKTIGQDVEDKNAWKRVTIQADKSLDFLTLKKIMYSIYEAGGGPINFAVAKDFKNENATPKDKNQ